jgi:hydroxymethylpyrimidine/phosphomethylpyrimidine kinase
MRQPAAVEPPVALTVAGSDSGGGAGVQADLKTMEAHDVFGTAVLTAVTAQNTRGVEGVTVLDPSDVRSQYEAVTGDLDVAAAKTGMLAAAPVVEATADLLAGFDGPTVVDPVMVAASGDRLLSPDAEAAYEALVARATLVTPNVDEAEVLTDRTVTDAADAREAAHAVVDAGAHAALVKGGHLAGDVVVDTLVVDEGRTDGGGGDRRVETFEHPRVDTDATHGSGCTLSAAVAARLARGEDLVDAVAAGTAFMERATRYPLDVGGGPGAVHHLVELRERAARAGTAEALEGVLAAFRARDVGPLVPEGGMDVVAATRYAEAPDEVLAAEGGLVRTVDGVATARGVRAGAGGRAARVLLGAREAAPSLRFAAGCRLVDEPTALASVLDGPVVEADRTTAGPDPTAGVGAGDGVDARARRSPAVARAVAGAERTPVAVVERGVPERPPVAWLVAADAAALRLRAFDLLDAAGSG